MAAQDVSVTLCVANARRSAELRMVSETMMWKKKSVLPRSRDESKGRISIRKPGTLFPKRWYMMAAEP